MILDTDFVIDLLGGDPDAEARARALVGDGQPITLPAMTMVEVLLGVESGAATATRTEVEAALDRFPVAEMDEAVAREAARMIADAGPGRFKKRKGDAVIAATAAVRGDPVVTRNVDDFERLGVDVVTY